MKYLFEGISDEEVDSAYNVISKIEENLKRESLYDDYFDGYWGDDPSRKTADDDYRRLQDIVLLYTRGYSAKNYVYDRDYKVFAPDTAKIVRLNDKDAVMLALDCEDDVYVCKDTLTNTFFTGTEIRLAVKNVPHDKRVALYECIPADGKFEAVLKNMLKNTLFSQLL